MKRVILSALIALIVVWSMQSLSAQAIPTSRLLFDEAAPDLATANAYTFKYYPDAAVVGTTLAGVICTGTVSPFTCTVGFPAFTPGSHTLTLTATNIAGESVKSAPFAFVFVVVPGAPVNIRIG